MSDEETPKRRKPCPVCGEMIVVGAKLCRHCGERFESSGKQEGDATGGLIPYKNPPALVAYYCGIFSLIACIPFLFPLPIVALVFGIKGLKKAKAEPHVRGQVHAWIGIVCGSIFTLVGLASTVMGILGIIANLTTK